MANELNSIFTSFGCFDDSDAPSLFDDLEALNGLNSPDNLTETNPEVGSLSPDYESEMMSIASSNCSSPQYEASNPEQDHADLYHTYGKNNPVMTGAVSPEYERSPSRGGSISSDLTEASESGNDLLLYLMNETGVNITEQDSETTERSVRQQQATRRLSTTASTSSRKGRKRQLTDVPDDEESEGAIDKNRKNAIAARENRLKKKRYIEGLEKENKSLTDENSRLMKDNKNMKDRVSSLEAETDYLKSVLYNQSALSALLKKLGPKPQVRLSSSFHARKQSLQKQLLEPNGGSSGGVCLHVNGKDASLEFCAQCASMAEGASHH